MTAVVEAIVTEQGYRFLAWAPKGEPGVVATYCGFAGTLAYRVEGQEVLDWGVETVGAARARVEGLGHTIESRLDIKGA